MMLLKNLYVWIAVVGSISSLANAHRYGEDNIEHAKYEVVHTGDDYEVRKYMPGVAIQTTESSENTGFMKLAGYIGVMGVPENETREKIAMTAPVVETLSMMQFILPESKYTRVEEAPTPTKDDVKLVQLKERMYVVKTYHGNTNMKEAEEKAVAMMDRVAGDSKMKIELDKSDWASMRYDSPWTPADQKTNDVAVRVINMEKKDKKASKLRGSSKDGEDDYEHAKYDVMYKTDNYEVRRYTPAVGIKTPGQDGFMTLAGYIGVMSTPQNERKEKIAMTSPVFQSPESMEFILPQSKFTRAEDAPTPTNSAVELEQLEERMYVVHTYGGWTNMKEAEQKATEMMAQVEEDNKNSDTVLKLDSGDWAMMQYDPPWTPANKRTNDVAVRVTKMSDNYRDGESVIDIIHM